MWNKILVLVIAVSFSKLAPAQKANKNSDKPVTISGMVLSSDKQPVAGAVMYIDNIKTSNITRSDGSYKIKVSPTASYLGVRSSQYGNSETLIKGRTTINFTFGSTDGSVKGGTDSLPVIPDNKSDRTAKKMNTYNDIYQMIRMEVSGVVVSGRSIRIRQGRSFFGSSTPLFVVNGVIVPGIDNVNPVEVKSIQVLTGSSASIYGVNGTNGVISITLKDGTTR